MYRALQDDLREMAWLASIIGCLSAAGVAPALAPDGWQHVPVIAGLV